MRCGAVIAVVFGVLAVLLVLYRPDESTIVRLEHTGTLWAYKLLLPRDVARSRARDIYMNSTRGGAFLERVALNLLATNYSIPHPAWPMRHGVVAWKKRAHERCLAITRRYFEAAEDTCDEYHYLDSSFFAYRECREIHLRYHRYAREQCDYLLTPLPSVDLHMDIVCSNVVVEASQAFFQQILHPYSYTVNRYSLQSFLVREVPHFNATRYDYYLEVEGERLPWSVFDDNYESAVVPGDVDLCFDHYHAATTHLVDAARDIEVITAPLETRLAWERYEYFSDSEYQHYPWTTVAVCKVIDEEVEPTDDARVPNEAEWATNILVEIVAQSLWLDVRKRDMI